MIHDMPCSRRKVEEDLVFCPYLLGCVREGAPICQLCTWSDPVKEEELYYKFMKHLEDVRANLAREEPVQIDEFWWEARVKVPEVKVPQQLPKPEAAKLAQPSKPARKRPAKASKPALTIDYHLNRVSENLREVLTKLREEIFKLDVDIEEKVNRTFIGYRSRRMKHYFANVRALPLKHEIEVRFRSGGPIDDPKGLSKPIPKSFDTPMDRRVRIQKPEQIPYVINLLKQAYRNLVS